MKRLLALAAFVCVAAPLAAAEPRAVSVDHARISLRDVLPDAPADLATEDLGSAPPAGGSLLLTPDAIASRLGDRASSVKLPKDALRVVAPAKVYSARQLGDFVQPAVAAALRPGVSLVRVEPTVGATISPRATVKSVTVPRIRQRGPQRATAVVEIARDGETMMRLPVTVAVEVDEQAAKPDVPRGAKVALVVSQGGFEIRADAITLADADVGDTVKVTVERTHRVATARLRSDHDAELVERP